MIEEYELMAAMTSYVEGVTEKIQRIDRRIRNEPDESTGEMFDYLNRRFVSDHDIEKLSAALWALIMQVNQTHATARYWHEFVEPMKSRIHFYDEDEIEAETLKVKDE